MGSLYMGWTVSIRDGVLVNKMDYYFPGWGVRLWDGESVYGMVC